METAVLTIHQNMERVTERIQRAAQSANRKPADIRLVVVTKGQPVELVRAVIEAGAGILGENYPEESRQKIETIGRSADFSWHMIGHLQSRKAPIVTKHFDMLQSLDSLHLAEKLNRLLEEPVETHQAGDSTGTEMGSRQRFPVLLEMNVSGEESKFGWPAWDKSQWDRLLPEIEQVIGLSQLKVQGLMTMPPYFEDAQQTRPFFVRMRKLSEFLGKHFGLSTFADLSMGTSIDYEAAVQEGATYIRIGTAIVGPRPKKVGLGIQV